MDAVAALSVPPIAVTDGSPDPVWVDLPCRTDWAYGRRPTLRLPLDAAAAAVARRWTRLDRRQRLVWRPLHLTAGCAMLASSFLPGDGGRLATFRLVAWLAIVVSSLWTDHLVKKVFRGTEIGITPLFAFVLLVGAAIVSFFKALPVGFIRLDDERA